MTLSYCNAGVEVLPLTEMASAIDIIIPFYRNPELVEPLFQSLEAVQDELACLNCSVIAINDSPEDKELQARLRAASESLSNGVACRVLENERNLGFVRSVNAAVREAMKQKHDVLLLNSDTVVFPGAIAEIRHVAYSDPMIGFVSPRSNNATICSLPHDDNFKNLSPAASYDIFLEICQYLPRFHFVPTGVGFCLFIKFEVLDEFGLLDEAYGQGYNEENDLIMKANRCGYQVALANHAFVYHVGEASFSISSSPKQVREEHNAALLNERFPEYLPNVIRYFESPHCQAERLITGMLPDRYGRRDLVFDFSTVGTYHNGTFEVAKEILTRAVKTWRQFNLYVMVSEEAMRFHKLDELERVVFVTPDTKRKFAIAFRFAQPFDYEQLVRMSRIAVFNVYSMLDPIAFDCRYLRTPDLDRIWNTVFTHADGVIYISDFVKEQFHRRFRPRPGLRELVTYLSLDYRDYFNGCSGAVSDGAYILVIGNSFAHKNLPVTIDALSKAFPRDKIVAFGLREEDGRHNVIPCPSGGLSERQLDELLRGARLVVFPSVYEGFGIPVVRSLAYGKPVLARSIPVTRAIKEKLGEPENLILYSSTRNLIELLQDGFPNGQDDTHQYGNPHASWDAITAQIGRFLEELLGSIAFADVLVPRLAYLNILQARAQEVAELQQSRLMIQQLKEQEQSSHVTIDELSLALKDREAWTQQMYGSLSWRITAPLRLIGEALLRLRGK